MRRCATWGSALRRDHRPRHARRGTGSSGRPGSARRRRRRPALDPGRRDQHRRRRTSTGHRRSGPDGGRAAHPGLRRRPGRRGARRPRSPRQRDGRRDRIDADARARSRRWADAGRRGARARRRAASTSLGRPACRARRSCWPGTPTSRRATPSRASSTGAARATCRGRASGPRDAIEAIVAAGGIAVLAHPSGARGPARRSCAPLVDWGLGGLEVALPHASTTRPCERMRRLAREPRAARHRRLRLPWRRRSTTRRRSACIHGPRRGRRRRCSAALEATAAPDEPARRSSLPVLDIAPPAPRDAAPRRGRGRRRGRRSSLTDDQVLPRFHVWTLGCQMNHSDSEEMAGALLAAGCAEAAGARGGRPHRHQHAAPSARRPSRRSSGGWASLARLKAANPGLRVVLTGCSVRADNDGDLQRRYPAVDLFLRPDQEPELAARLGLAGATVARAPLPGARGLQRVGRSRGRRPPTACRARAPPRSRTGRVARGAATHAWLPIIYGCDKTCTYCIVPVQPRAGAQPAVRRRARRGARAGRRRLPRGHAARPERQLLRPRPAAEPRFADVHGGAHLGRDLPLDGRPDIAALLRAIDGLRDAGRRAAHPAPALRDLASLGPRRAAHRGHGRVPVGLRAPPPAGPVGRRRGAPPDGPPVHRRTPTSSSWSGCAPRSRASPHDRRHRRLLRRDRGPVRGARSTCCATVRFDQVFAAAFSPRPGTPAARLADDVPAAEKRRRLNALLGAPGGHRPRAQPGLGRPDDGGAGRGGPAGAVATTTRRRTGPGDRRRRGSSGATARTSSSTSTAPPSSSGAVVDGRSSSTPGRTRSSGRLARRHGLTRARPAAARRHRRAPPRPARPRSRWSSPAQLGERRDRLRRLAPGLPRHGHRHGQGRRRRERAAGAAPRPRPRRPGRALQRPPTTGAHALAALAGIAGAAGSRSSSAAPGLYLRAVGTGRAARRHRARPGDPGRARGAPRRATAWPRSSTSCARATRHGRRRIDLANPRRVVRALERPARDRRPRHRRPAGYPAPVVWLGIAPRPRGAPEAIEARAREQFASGLLDEAAALRARYAEDLPAFSAMGYREAFDVLAGRCDARRRRSPPTPRGRAPTRGGSAPGSAPSPTSPGCRRGRDWPIVPGQPCGRGRRAPTSRPRATGRCRTGARWRRGTCRPAGSRGIRESVLADVGGRKLVHDLASAPPSMTVARPSMTRYGCRPSPWCSLAWNEIDTRGSRRRSCILCSSKNVENTSTRSPSKPAQASVTCGRPSGWMVTTWPSGPVARRSRAESGFVMPPASYARVASGALGLC